MLIASGTAIKNKQAPITSMRRKNWHTDISLNVPAIKVIPETRSYQSAYLHNINTQANKKRQPASSLFHRDVMCYVSIVLTTFIIIQLLHSSHLHLTQSITVVVETNQELQSHAFTLSEVLQWWFITKWPRSIWLKLRAEARSTALMSCLFIQPRFTAKL